MHPRLLRRSSRFTRVFLVAACLFAGRAAQAYPHRGEHFTLHQPDGTPVEVVVHGDEYYARAESTDGFALVVDQTTGQICYAGLGADGDLVSTGIPYTGDEDVTDAGHPRKRTRAAVEAALQRRGIPRGLRHSRAQRQRHADDVLKQLWGGKSAPWNAPAPSAAASSGGAQSAAILPAAPTGTVTGLVVLVDFPDRVATISQAEVSSGFNAATYGDSRGSIRSWSETISYSKVSVNHLVAGYYRARYPTSHYLHGTTWDYTAAEELMKEVYAYVDANHDLRSLSVINGALSSLAVIYAGDIISNGWANSLWPHAGGANYATSEGVRITHYYMSNLGARTPVSLSTHRHELGHAFFNWPDTYDYDGDSKSAGGYAMETDIPCAPFRMLAGWLNVIDVNGLDQAYALAPNGNTALRYRNPANSKEYFVVDYLRRTGWNSAAPDEGLIVWHVDEAGDNSYQDMTPSRHYELSVEQADGRFDLERNVAAGDGDLFHAGYKTLFDATTVPNSNWWSGAASGLRLSSIGAIASTMTVTVGSGTVTTYALTVGKSGAGTGTVTSSTGGISCGTACSAALASGTSVTLTAAAASGSTFAGWSGACVGTGACVVTMTANQSVTATFNTSSGGTTYALTVAKTGTGSGTVTSSTGGISCGAACSATIASGTTVTLTATAASGSTFAGWSNGCTGTAATCTVSMTAARTVTATFNTSGGGTTPCANPVTFANQSGNFNTAGAICLRTSATVNGWGCSNFDGRTVSVNGGTATTTCGAGPFPLAKWSDGYTYFSVSAGTYTWASLYSW